MTNDPGGAAQAAMPRFRPAPLLPRAAGLCLAACLFLLSAPGGARGAEPSAAPGADAPLTFAEADRRLDVADRLLQGGIFDQALSIANAVLDDPAARAIEGDPADIRMWLVRRERARFIRERGLLGLAETTEQFEEAAEQFVQLSNNRYRLAEPAYAVQSAYWAGRAYEATGEYRSAIDNYSRVGGIDLPPEMEGDAAQRTSRSLRRLADALPYPGTMRDRDERSRLLNQAIAELDRARLAFPVGARRKEIELDLIALRMARREEQFVRDAASEAEAYFASEPAKDELRARAALFRGQAAAMLGDEETAAFWFRRVADEEAPTDEDRRSARLGLALALMETSEGATPDGRGELLRQAGDALEQAIAGTVSPGQWDGARVIKAQVLLELEQPTAALETLQPVLGGDRLNPAAWRVAGIAELRRGRLTSALEYLYPPTLPSNPRQNLRYAASRDAARTADARRDFGLALALNHRAGAMLRRDRVFSSLLVNEFLAMETLLKLGKMDGPVSLSGDIDLLTVNSEAPATSRNELVGGALEALGRALGKVLWTGGDPDAGYDLAVRTEAAHEWNADGMATLELAIAMISHLAVRTPAGVTDSTLSSRLGEARHALALARAELILAGAEPDEAAIDRTLGDFAAAAASFQKAASGGTSLGDDLDQGMVNMESGAFLMRLAEKWERGRWAARAAAWRDEAKLRVEASLRPFNQAIATSGQSSLASRRAKWSRGRALEVLGEWRGAAADYLSLMNNSELPRVLRANAARHWAVCMGRLGSENQAALTRLAVFAEIDAEAALLAGRLAEDSGNQREAYRQYLFAADPSAPAIPPATPGRVQEAAYRAARLALADPTEANPLLPAPQVIADSRRLLEENARTDLAGAWAVPMLNLLGDSLMKDLDGWERAYRLAMDIIETRGSPPATDRAMYLLAAKAQEAGGSFARALDELDAARELLDGSQESRADAALVTLETARVFRRQDRAEDAVRAYAEVFAMYPEQEEAESAARVESAETLLSRPGAGAREREQARGILSGLRDQLLAEKIMRDYGIR